MRQGEGCSPSSAVFQVRSTAGSVEVCGQLRSPLAWCETGGIVVNRSMRPRSAAAHFVEAYKRQLCSALSERREAPRRLSSR